MNGCIYRMEDGKCKQFSVGGVLSFCYLDGKCDCQIPSNADRIRAKTDEGLAEYLYKHDFCIAPFKSDVQNWCDGDCEKCVADWLKSPVEVET